MALVAIVYHPCLNIFIVVSLRILTWQHPLSLWSWLRIWAHTGGECHDVLIDTTVQSLYVMSTHRHFYDRLILHQHYLPVFEVVLVKCSTVVHLFLNKLVHFRTNILDKILWLLLGDSDTRFPAVTNFQYIFNCRYIFISQ